jgi:putative DNA primase/helicase
MAGIRVNRLPDTAVSRAIRIPLIRKRKTDKVERLREAHLQAELEPLRQQLMRWSMDHAQEISAADPVLPDELDGRAADNWSVLISVADAFGGEWPARARKAALKLELDGETPDSVGEMLLADLQDLFAQRGADRLSSEEITCALVKLEGRPWAEWGKQRKPLSKNDLARLLRDFRIEPRSIRFNDGKTAKGYYREWFDDAWERYVPPQSPAEPSQRHSQESTGSELNLGAGTSSDCVPASGITEAAPPAVCDGVTARTTTLEERESLPPGPLKEFLNGLNSGVEP